MSVASDEENTCDKIAECDDKNVVEETVDLNLNLEKISLRPAKVSGRIRRESAKKTAEEYAYESLAANLDDRISYDYVEDLDEWLEKNSPSNVQRQGHIGWIQVSNPEVKVDFGDYETLTKDWEDLKKAGEAINYKHIHSLAVKNRVLCGFWLVHVDTGAYYVDRMWKRIVKEFVEGDLRDVSFSVQVSPWDTEQKQAYKHRIKVWNADFNDDRQVNAIHDALRKTGVRTVMHYKPNVYSSLMIYRNNEYNMRPSLFISTFDLMKKASVITQPNAITSESPPN